jgi:hypothetical protein
MSANELETPVEPITTAELVTPAEHIAPVGAASPAGLATPVGPTTDLRQVSSTNPFADLPIGKVLLILFLIPVAALLAALFFDRDNMRIESIVKSKGGQTYRKTNRKEPSILPEYTWFTQWQHPVAEIDLTACNVTDQDVAEICGLAGKDLKILILDDNPNITQESVRHIDRLRTLDSISIKGTSISNEQARSLILHKGYFVGLGSGTRTVRYGPIANGQIP